MSKTLPEIGRAMAVALAESKLYDEFSTALRKKGGVEIFATDMRKKSLERYKDLVKLNDEADKYINNLVEELKIGK